jgi:hypothetical protein
MRRTDLCVVNRVTLLIFDSYSVVVRVPNLLLFYVGSADRIGLYLGVVCSSP